MTRIKGITDEVGTCDCCGRTDLKRTVILECDGAVSYLGSECAARATGHRRKSDVEKLAVKAQAETDQKDATRKFYAAFLSDEARVAAAYQASVDRACGVSFASFVDSLRKAAAAA